jgi:hypothetical protein
VRVDSSVRAARRDRVLATLPNLPIMREVTLPPAFKDLPPPSVTEPARRLSRSTIAAARRIALHLEGDQL